MASLAALALAVLCALPIPALADGIELKSLDIKQTEDGVLLSYAAHIELPRAVEDALQKGVPLYFVAQAELFRSRWYWRDKLLVRAVRNWRLTWQPLSRRYRVNFGSFNQSFDTLAEAMESIDRSTRWRLVDAGGLEADADHYLDFSFRLDTSQLPRPLEISFGGQPEWQLAVERSLKVPPPASAAASQPASMAASAPAVGSAPSTASSPAPASH